MLSISSKNKMLITLKHIDRPSPPCMSTSVGVQPNTIGKTAHRRNKFSTVIALLHLLANAPLFAALRAARSHKKMSFNSPTRVDECCMISTHARAKRPVAVEKYSPARANPTIAEQKMSATQALCEGLHHWESNKTWSEQVLGVTVWRCVQQKDEIEREEEGRAVDVSVPRRNQSGQHDASHGRENY
jgi:hypothetical protein